VNGLKIGNKYFITNYGRRIIMKTIKVYDVKKYIESMDFDGKKYITHGIYSGLAIIEGISGALIFDEEACGKICGGLEDTYPIGLNDIPTDNMISAIAKYTIKPTLKELMQAESKEMLITDYVERYQYKSRISSNLHDLLNAFSKIGLDKKEYCTIC
jgi:hypothetical protein